MPEVRPHLSSVVHTPKCSERMAAADAARTAWRKLWPEACPTCAGRGIVATMSEEGIRLEEECYQCMAYGTCPRCGAPDALGPEPFPKCRSCSWTLNTPGEPAIAGCTCNTEAPHA